MARHSAGGLMQCLMRSLALFVVLIAMAACDRSRDQLAGKWKVQGDASSMVWEFAKNGSVKAGSSPGKYSFGDRGRLKIQTQFATFVYEIEIAGDKMIWKDPNGSRTELKRMP